VQRKDYGTVLDTQAYKMLHNNGQNNFNQKFKKTKLSPLHFKFRVANFHFMFLLYRCYFTQHKEPTPVKASSSYICYHIGCRYGVVQFEALRYKPEGRGFDSRLCY